MQILIFYLTLCSNALILEKEVNLDMTYNEFLRQLEEIPFSQWERHKEIEGVTIKISYITYIHNRQIKLKATFQMVFKQGSMYERDRYECTFVTYELRVGDELLSSLEDTIYTWPPETVYYMCTLPPETDIFPFWSVWTFNLWCFLFRTQPSLPRLFYKLQAFFVPKEEKARRQARIQGKKEFIRREKEAEEKRRRQAELERIERE